MPFAVDSVEIADISRQTVTLERLLGAFEICFRVDVATKRYGQQSRWANILGARVRLARASADLGTALCVQPRFLTQTDPGRRSALEFRLAVSPWQLGALEDARNGGDLDFTLSLIFEAGNEPHVRNVVNQTIEVSVHTSRSDWVNHLNSAHAMSILLLEIPMPLGGSSAEEPVARVMCRALDHFAAGRYSDCVGECRKILERLPNVSKSDVVELLKSGRSTMSKQERDQSVLLTLRNYCNPPHHAESESWSDYERADAKLILVMTAAYIENRANTTKV